MFCRGNCIIGSFYFIKLWIIVALELWSLTEVQKLFLPSFQDHKVSAVFSYKNWISPSLEGPFGSAVNKVSLCGHSHVPRRSSRKPICSLRESMRSSCWKEWDSKVVFSKPSSRERGKKLLNGAKTNCSFCSEKNLKKTKKTWRNIASTFNLHKTHACIHKTVRIWHFKESLLWRLNSIQVFMSSHEAPGVQSREVSG